MSHASIDKVITQSCSHKMAGAYCGGNPQTPWWTPAVRGVVQLKEASQALWRQLLDRVRLRGTQMGGFGETMEKKCTNSAKA